MADVGQLTRALQRAHQAGDTAAARRLAAEIKRARGMQQQSHPEFDPSNVPGGVPGYDPATGLVNKPVGMMDSAAIGALDTATLGFGDEAAAGIASLMGSDYDTVLGNMRELQGESAAQNPWTHLAGQIGGGTLLAAATRGASALPNATSLAGKVLGGALTGAGYGGAYGFGSGEGFGDRLWGAARDGTIGGIAGGAFPLLAAGAGKAYQGVRNWWSAKPIAQNAGASPEALRVLGGVLDADGTLGPQGQANMGRAGQEAMLVDAGPTATRALDTAIQRSGPGAVVARNAIDGRVSRDAAALSQALDDALGKPQGVTATRSAIRTNSAAARSSAYDDAYRMAIDYADPRGQAIEQIVKTRVPQSAISRANELMRAGGEKSKQILAQVADDGTVTFETLPDVRQLDYITRALNDLASSGEGQGALGGQTAIGRAYEGLSREIRDGLRDLVPEYGQALETAADPIRRSKAVELGARLLSPSMTRDQVDEAVRGMTKAEKSALAQGVRSQIDDAMAQVTRTVQDGDVPAREAIKALRDLSRRANREKLTTAIGSDEAGKLFDELDRVAQSFNLRARVSDNSATYARQAMDRRIKDATALGPVGRAARGDPVASVKDLTRSLTGYTDDAMRSSEDRLYAEIAELLTRQGGAGQRVYSAINQMGQTDLATQLMVERITKALSGPHLAYPATVLGSEALR